MSILIGLIKPFKREIKMKRKRVVITGIGVIAPNGIGISDFWDSLIHGKSAIKMISYFDASSYPCQIAAEVPNFDPRNYMDMKTAKRLARFAQFAFASSQMAVEDSQIDFNKEDPYRIGVYVGTAMGGEDFNEIQHTIFLEKGLNRISPFTVVSCSTHSASAIISCFFGARGTNTTIAAGCNSGLDAIFLAYNAIRLGDADIIILSTGEAPITPYIYGAFCATGYHSKETQEPKSAVKPYDIDSDGMVLGEGGGALIIEELEHAFKRGAKIYGEILSYSSLSEAFDLIEVDPNNGTITKSFRQTIERAEVDIKNIDFINAHGNGILTYDISETKAIKEIFGDLAYDIPITSIKPITGHSIAPTPVWQVIVSLLSFKYGIIPPILNLKKPAPECNLNYVTNKYLRKEVSTALIHAHGFGGRVTTLLISKLKREKEE